MWNESAGGRKRYDLETDWEALESKLNPDRTHSTCINTFRNIVATIFLKVFIQVE